MIHADSNLSRKLEDGKPMNLTELESMTYVNIDVNSCWKQSKDEDDLESFLFRTLPMCDEEPKVIIENQDGKFVLQFKKVDSIFILKDNKFWYNKNNLTSIRKL